MSVYRTIGPLVKHIIKYVPEMTPKVCKKKTYQVNERQTMTCVTLNAKKWWSGQINISAHINQTLVRSLVYINQTALLVIEWDVPKVSHSYSITVLSHLSLASLYGT